MKFVNGQLTDLMAMPTADPQQGAERANLCLEDRVSSARQAHYESQVSAAADWDDWRGHHFRYVHEEVRRRFPLSAAFTPGEPALRPGVESNQWLIRIERIDGLLSRYNADTGTQVDPGLIQSWIAELASPSPAPDRSASSLADLGRLMAGADNTAVTPGAAALGELTDLLNQDRSDGRPAFVAFDAEFANLASGDGWADEIVERCGLAHLCTDGPVTLALFRYRAQEVLDGKPSGKGPATLFAVPTVVDQPFYNVFHPAPGMIDWGHAVDLAPADDCARLAAELIHARIDYRPEHWVAVSTSTRPTPDSAEIARLRDQHLGCLRDRSGQAGYGAGC